MVEALAPFAVSLAVVALLAVALAVVDLLAPLSKVDVQEGVIAAPSSPSPSCPLRACHDRRQ